MLCFFVIYNLSLLVITFPDFSFFCCVHFVMSFFFQFRHAVYLIRLITSSRGLPKWLPSMAAITHFVSQTVRFHSQCPEGSCQVIAPSIEGKAILWFKGIAPPHTSSPFSLIGDQSLCISCSLQLKTSKLHIMLLNTILLLEPPLTQVLICLKPVKLLNSIIFFLGLKGKGSFDLGTCSCWKAD